MVYEVLCIVYMGMFVKSHGDSNYVLRGASLLWVLPYETVDKPVSST